jgi:hypothetical protein
MSEKSTLFVFASPVEGKEDEFNDWYDNTHLREIIALPGVVSGRRLKGSPNGPKAPQAYVTVFELTDDPASVLEAMGAGIQDGSLHMSDAVDPASVSMSGWDAV